MSELMNARECNTPLRHRLMLAASSAALACLVAAQEAKAADDSDHPVVWIEVGGAFDQLSDGDARWLPPNLTPPQTNPQPGPFGKMPSAGFDEDLKVSFTPNDSDWVFSAALRYGRALRGPKGSHDQSYKFNIYTTAGVPYSYDPTNRDFANTAQRSKSTHMMLDFQASRDVGLGLFGGTSLLGLGVRVAKLNESANGHLTALVSARGKYNPGEVAHKADFLAKHSFSGLGPEVTWDAATPFAGTLSNGFSFDWGANAALLFGRQKANISLRTKDERYNGNIKTGYDQSGRHTYRSGIPTVLSQSTQSPMRNKTVVIPNVGGFAGLSWHLPNAKISLGYRADFFFGAIDGGIATSQKETRGFYGPFANVSIGLGG